MSGASTSPSDEGVRPPGPDSARRDGALVLALVLLLGASFSSKAFHIDDAFFIAVAQNILAHPLRPFDGAVALDDTDRRVFARQGTHPNTFETLSHPPLVPYVIAAVSLASGGIRERPEHAAFVLFSLLAACSQYSLALRFGRAPLAATLFLVSSPIFILGSQSLMTDVPALALSLAALALFVSGADAEDPRRLLLAGVLAGLAILTRYVALGLVPLCALYVVGRKGRAARAALALAPLALVAGGWCLQNWWAHGALHLVASARHYFRYYGAGQFSGAGTLRKAVSELAALGGTALPPFLLLLVSGDRARRALVLVLSLAAAAWLCVLQPFSPDLREYGPVEKGAVVLCLGVGVSLVCEAVRRRAAAEGDRWFLLLWLAGALLGTVLLLPFGAARYMLPVLPPLILILCPAPGGGEQSRRPRVWTALAVALTLALGATLAAADFEYAGAYRSFVERLPAVAGERPVWFVGDWGFRYYMQRAGHRYLLSTDESPREGDLVVRPRVAGVHELAPGLRQRIELVESVDASGSLPIRLMSFEARAGFYSDNWGLLPYAFSSAPLERFDVYRVTASRP